jgi:hypothetical protein
LFAESYKYLQKKRFEFWHEPFIFFFSWLLDFIVSCMSDMKQNTIYRVKKS